MEGCHVCKDCGMGWTVESGGSLQNLRFFVIRKRKCARLQSCKVEAEES